MSAAGLDLGSCVPLDGSLSFALLGDGGGRHALLILPPTSMSHQRDQQAYRSESLVAS